MKLNILTLSLLIIFASCKKEEVEKPLPNPIPNTQVGMNLNFEEWQVFTQNQISYEEPSGNFWTSLNSLAKLNGPITVMRTNDSQNGNYAALLETKEWGNLKIPGLLVVGTFLPQEPFVFEGKPYTETPSSLSGYYKYLPSNQDTAIVYAKLSKFNPLKGYQDTIAETSLVITQAVPNYTFFNMNFDYKTDLQPDSITIIFVSSIDGANFNGQVGSKLFVDNLKLNTQ
jgi:hypothetical protein